VFRHRTPSQKEGTCEDGGDLEVAPFEFEEEDLPEQDVKFLVRHPGRHHCVAIVPDAP